MSYAKLASVIFYCQPHLGVMCPIPWPDSPVSDIADVLLEHRVDFVKDRPRLWRHFGEDDVTVIVRPIYVKGKGECIGIGVESDILVTDEVIPHPRPTEVHSQYASVYNSRIDRRQRMRGELLTIVRGPSRRGGRWSTEPHMASTIGAFGRTPPSFGIPATIFTDEQPISECAGKCKWWGRGCYV